MQIATGHPVKAIPTTPCEQICDYSTVEVCNYYSLSSVFSFEYHTLKENSFNGLSAYNISHSL